jgi:hypothetical protein
MAKLTVEDIELKGDRKKIPFSQTLRLKRQEP